METIGQRIKYLRDSFKLSQQQVAEKTGISRGNISNYEKDRVSPAADTIIAICAYFHVSADWLLTGKETVTEDPGTRESLAGNTADVIDLSGELDKKAVYMKTTEEEERLVLMYREFSREDKDFTLNMIQFKYEQTQRDEKKKQPSSS
ncbi:helix-turn-helix domain-containing protein [Paenibacillus sp. SI8]|uniref:helix-turn-helix domain-containing protein n=1 Tax=unclassified Paenibacillus TaxID=185978 RepID=UPI00346720C4